MILLHVVLEPVYVHVYRLKGSDLGFYHTGVGEDTGSVAHFVVS